MHLPTAIAPPESPASRRSASRYAVLGMLSLGPMSGYEIRQRIGRSVQHFWSESYGQIYPTLKQLAAEGLVGARTAGNGGRSTRQVYGLTAAGRRALHHWLQQAPRLQPPRSELLLKLFFGPEGDIETQKRHMREVRERAQQRIELYGRIVAEVSVARAGHPALPYWLITLDCGSSQARALSDWCDRALRQLDRIGRSTTGKKNGTSRRSPKRQGINKDE